LRIEDRQSNSADLGVRAAAALLLLVLAACGSVPKRPPAIEREPRATAPQKAPPQAAKRGGAFYQDDGPGDRLPADLGNIPDAEPRVEPLNRFANNPYSVFGQQYVPMQSLRPYRERGTGSWYGRKFQGGRTSSGEPYDMYAMTAAHPTLPIPSYARVTNVANGRSVIVRVNDRGPFHSGRIIDLSYTAAWKLGYANEGGAMLEVQAVTPDEMPALAAQRRAAPANTEVAAASAPASSEQPVKIGTAAASPPAGDSARSVRAAAIPVENNGSGVYLQLGAFSGRGNAESFRARIARELSWLDHAIEILHQGGLFRLHLGPYRDPFEALAAAERIRAALELKPVLVVR